MKKFTKSDLRDGDIVEYHDGRMRIVNGNYLYDDNNHRVNNLNRYDENLEPVAGSINIVRAYRIMWEREESTITAGEKIILQNIDSKYKYIARDYSGKLYIYIEEPKKHDNFWIAPETSKTFHLFNHLFKMVKWEDEEPWLIEDLLKLPEKENENEN